jgi:hypothetical protein
VTANKSLATCLNIRTICLRFVQPPFRSVNGRDVMSPHKQRLHHIAPCSATWHR